MRRPINYSVKFMNFNLSKLHPQSYLLINSLVTKNPSEFLDGSLIPFSYKEDLGEYELLLNNLKSREKVNIKELACFISHTQYQYLNSKAQEFGISLEDYNFFYEIENAMDPKSNILITEKTTFERFEFILFLNGTPLLRFTKGKVGVNTRIKTKELNKPFYLALGKLLSQGLTLVNDKFLGLTTYQEQDEGIGEVGNNSILAVHNNYKYLTNEPIKVESSFNQLTVSLIPCTYSKSNNASTSAFESCIQKDTLSKEDSEILSHFLSTISNHLQKVQKRLFLIALLIAPILYSQEVSNSKSINKKELIDRFLNIERKESLERVDNKALELLTVLKVRKGDYSIKIPFFDWIDLSKIVDLSNGRNSRKDINLHGLLLVKFPYVDISSQRLIMESKSICLIESLCNNSLLPTP